MGRPPLRSDQLETFRESLCDAALKLFAEDGYEAVTLRALARALACSHALPYRYFASKEDIFVAVRLRCFERFCRYHEGRDDAVDPALALRRMAQRYVAFALEEPHAFRVMFDLGKPHLANLPQLRAAHRRAFRILERTVARAIEAGALAGTPAELAPLFWASIHGIATLQVGGSFSSRMSAVGLADRAADALLRAHRPPRTRPLRSTPAAVPG